MQSCSLRTSGKGARIDIVPGFGEASLPRSMPRQDALCGFCVSLRASAGQGPLHLGAFVFDLRR